MVVGLGNALEACAVPDEETLFVDVHDGDSGDSLFPPVTR